MKELMKQIRTIEDLLEAVRKSREEDRRKHVIKQKRHPPVYRPTSA